MTFRSNDLPIFFADFGADTRVEFNSVSAYPNGAPILGILDSGTDIFTHGGGPGGFETSLYTLRIPYNAFSPMPRPQDLITVAGVAYVVKELPKNQDASITEMRLKAV